MNRDDEIKDLLIEIRDNQKLSLQRQEEHLEIARQQVDRANRQVTESIELQKLAIAKAKQVARIAIPGIIFVHSSNYLFGRSVFLSNRMRLKMPPNKCMQWDRSTRYASVRQLMRSVRRHKR